MKVAIINAGAHGCSLPAHQQDGGHAATLVSRVPRATHPERDGLRNCGRRELPVAVPVVRVTGLAGSADPYINALRTVDVLQGA